MEKFCFDNLYNLQPKLNKTGPERLRTQLKKIICSLFAALAIHFIITKPAAAETLRPAVTPQCQQIELPGDKQLVDFKTMRTLYSMNQYRGMTIGKIHIVNLPIFNLHDPRENNVLFRFINNIHTPTKHSVLRRYLLFKKGEVLEPRLLSESERILRENSFLIDAIVLPFQRCNETLDLLVVVRDLWTLLPKFYLSRKGGEDEYGLILEDKNIFGTGNTLYFELINEPEQDTKTVGFSSKQFLGSRINMGMAYSDSTDGLNKKLELTRPFYALDTSWSLGVKINERNNEQSLEAFNQDIRSFAHRENEYQLFAGYSQGLKEGFSQRYSFGFTRSEDSFEPFVNPSTLPAERILSYPWAKYSIIEDNFKIYRNLYSLFRTEDVAVGVNFSTLLGYADDSFDSELSQWVFSLTYSDYPIMLERHLLKVKLKSDGYLDRETHDFTNTISTIDLSYFWSLSNKSRLYFNLSYDHGNHLTLDQLLPLGGDEGLRGYPSEYLLGERRLLVNLEHRYYFNTHYLNLFRFAGVIFFDMGQTKFGEKTVVQDSELLTSTGVGIRINSSKTNISRIIHVDLAFPLDEKDKLEHFQLRITADMTF